MQSPSPHGFTPSPAERPVRVGFSARVVILLGAAAVAAAIWGGAATWYILFRDDFVQTFLARQTEMRFAYEDRVADLRSRLQREITSGLVERRGFGGRIDALAKRQMDIESRQVWLASLAERAGLGQAPGAAPASSGGDLARPPAPPAPILPHDAPPSDLDSTSLPAKSGFTPLAPLDLRLRENGEAPGPRAADRLSALEQSARRASEVTLEATEALRRAARERSLSIRHAMAATRVPLPTGSVTTGASGGPFVPAPAALDAAAFAPLAADTEQSVADLERVSIAARALPVAPPLFGELEQTSGFGYRLDPFNRGAALHGGIDFRTPHGAPVRSTATGKVLTAGYSGGYGNMVEIEHEGGVTTRYGHLSAISVIVGQRIERGDLVGRAGSTGRSTGTHLHYETRIDGEPVDPARFLEAGRLLSNLP